MKKKNVVKLALTGLAVGAMTCACLTQVTMAHLVLANRVVKERNRIARLRVDAKGKMDVLVNPIALARAVAKEKMDALADLIALAISK